MQIYNSEKWRRHELYSTQLRFWAAFHFARTWSRCTIRYKTNAMTSRPVQLWRTSHRYNASQRVSKRFGVRVQTLPPLQTTTTTVANVICCRWCHLWRCFWMQWDGFIFLQVSNMLCVCLRYCRKWKKTIILFRTTRNESKINLSIVGLQQFISCRFYDRERVWGDYGDVWPGLGRNNAIRLSHSCWRWWQPVS